MYATGSRCGALTSNPGVPGHQLHHPHQSLHQQPYSYRRVVGGCNESSAPSLSGGVLSNNSQVLGGYCPESNGRDDRNQQQQHRHQSGSEHRTLADFLPASPSPSAGSCRQSQQALSYNSRYHSPQQQQQQFYDSSSPFDFAVGGPLGTAGDHPSGQRSRSFCGVQSQPPQPQPAHCGGRPTLGLHASVGPTSWVAEHQHQDSFRSTQSATSDMNSSVKAGVAMDTGVVKEEFSDPSDSYSSDTYSDQDWSSSRPGSASRIGRGFSESTTVLDGQQTDSTPRQRGRSRRNGRNSKMTPEEDERRRVRRERNKLAAARCRQRRVDLTNQLLAETESLEDEKLRLEKEISSLQRQRNQLEFVLEAHVPRCQVLGSVGPGGLQPPAAHVQPPPVTNAFGHGPSLHHLNTSTHGSVGPVVKVDKSNCSVAKTTEHGMAVTSSPNVTSCGRGRPASLSIARSHVVSSDVTPGVFNSIGLDCMIDGHTGLTPITGAPSCGGQRSTPDDVTMNGLSPTTLMTL